jgi:DnaJ-class molecular chaperone
MSDDYYDMLGVSRDATQAQIKRAYRRRALELHPDRQGGRGDEGEAFQRLTQAYEVLGDPEKRRRYDRATSLGTVPLFRALQDVDPAEMLRRFGRVVRSAMRRASTSPAAESDGERGDRDVYTEREVSFRRASMGGRVRVETIDGPVTMTIPPGTRSGTRFRLKDRGYGRGHHYVDVVVQTPVHHTERQRERIDASARQDASPARDGLVGRLLDVASGLRPGSR